MPSSLTAPPPLPSHVAPLSPLCPRGLQLTVVGRERLFAPRKREWFGRRRRTGAGRKEYVRVAAARNSSSRRFVIVVNFVNLGTFYPGRSVGRSLEPSRKGFLLLQ